MMPLSAVTAQGVDIQTACNRRSCSEAPPVPVQGSSLLAKQGGAGEVALVLGAGNQVLRAVDMIVTQHAEITDDPLFERECSATTRRSQRVKGFNIV